MKFGKFMAALTVSALSGLMAHAAEEHGSYVLKTDGEKVAVDSCGKDATAHWFKKQGTQNTIVLRVRNAKDCSNFSTGISSGKLDKDGQTDFEFNSIPGKTVSVTMTLESNSGKHSAVITAKVTTEGASPSFTILKPSNKITLKECGGTLEFKRTNRTPKDDYNVLVDTNKCNKFDILESGSNAVFYEAKDITKGQKQSFTLPSKVVDRGLSFQDPIVDLIFGTYEPNLIKIKIYNSGKPSIADIVYLHFYDSGNLNEVTNSNGEIEL